METQCLLALTLIILPIYLKLFHQKEHCKNLPPSPSSLPIVGHFRILKKPFNKSIDKLLQKFRRILVLKFGSRPVLVLSSPTAVKECSTKKDIIFANRPQQLLGKLVEKYSSIPMAQYGDLWKHLRRFTTIEMFSTSRLGMSSDMREKEASFLAKEMVKGCNREFKKVELRSVFSKLIFNYLARILGMDHYFEAEEMLDPKKAKDVMDKLRYAFTPRDYFRPGDFIPFMKWTGRWRTEKDTLEFINKRDKFIQNMINDTRSRWSTKSMKEQETKKKNCTRDLIVFARKRT